MTVNEIIILYKNNTVGTCSGGIYVEFKHIKTNEKLAWKGLKA